MKYLIFFILSVFVACKSENSTSIIDVDSSAKVTLVELGSTNCYYCKEMEPVLKSLRERYSENDLKIIIIDAVRDRKAAEPYKIRVMPTQVFLDDKGIEFHRHEGFYPETSIDSLLNIHGVYPMK